MTENKLERQQVVSILNEALEFYRMHRIRRLIQDRPSMPLSALQYELETHEMVGDYLSENLK